MAIADTTFAHLQTTPDEPAPVEPQTGTEPGAAPPAPRVGPADRAPDEVPTVDVVNTNDPRAWGRGRKPIEVPNPPYNEVS